MENGSCQPEEVGESALDDTEYDYKKRLSLTGKVVCSEPALRFVERRATLADWMESRVTNRL